MSETTTVGLLVTAVGSLVTAVVFIFRLLMAAKDMQFQHVIAVKDARISELVTDRDAYRGAAREGWEAAELAVNKLRQTRGQEPLPSIPPVVPEHRSPPTVTQLDAAALATLRAKAAVVSEALGLPVRTEKTDDDPEGTEHKDKLEKGEAVREDPPHIADVAIAVEVIELGRAIAEVKEDTSAIKEAIEKKEGE